MTSTAPFHKYPLTQEFRDEIMNVRLNVLKQIGATDGRNDSAEDGGGGIAADDGRCGGSLCQQQYVADSTASRSHQRRLRLSEVAGGSGGATTAGTVEAGGTNPKIGDRRISYLLRRRQKIEDAETASPVHLQFDTGRIPREMGACIGLSDGGAELCRATLRVRQEDRAGARCRAPVGAR